MEGSPLCRTDENKGQSRQGDRGGALPAPISPHCLHGRHEQVNDGSNANADNMLKYPTLYLVTNAHMHLPTAAVNATITSLTFTHFPDLLYFFFKHAADPFATISRHGASVLRLRFV